MFYITVDMERIDIILECMKANLRFIFGYAIGTVSIICSNQITGLYIFAKMRKIINKHSHSFSETSCL